MRTKIGMAAILAMLVVSVTGCGSASKEKKDYVTAQPVQTENQATTPAEELVKEKLYQSDYGYSISYDVSLFDAINEEGTDFFELKGQDIEKNIPIYISVTRIEDSVENTVKGLKLQSGLDEVAVDSTTMGKYHYPSKVVSYQTKEERGTAYQTFHVLAVKENVYLIEISNGGDVEETLSNAIETMLASFDAGELVSQATKTETVD